MTESAYRSLPSVDALLQSDEVAALIRDFSHDAVTMIARDVLGNARSRIKATGNAPAAETMIAEIVERVDTAWGVWPKAVVNATGVVLHTNLGRSPLSVSVAKAAADSASIYSGLEFDMASGKRGSRNAHISELISQISGADAGLAVNNNASGVLLTLAAVVGANPEKTEVIVSHGEAIEIGGGFRIPDVMHQSGAMLVEVGRARGQEPDLGCATLSVPVVLCAAQSILPLSSPTILVTVADLTGRGRFGLVARS